MPAPTFCMFIDEVGNADETWAIQPNNRYLSLTGVIIRQDDANDKLLSLFEKTKEAFFSDAPQPVIFHRKELVNKKPPFDSLTNPYIELLFNETMLAILRVLRYKVVTVVIDKFDHAQKYQLWRYHPYHYCMEILLERYVLHMENMRATGEVIAEGRGKKEDAQLCLEYSRLYTYGTKFVPSTKFRTFLTSRDLKIHQKKDNIAGLQLVDIIAHPSYRSILATRLGERVSPNFGTKIVAILRHSKYLRSARGEIEGYGCKWLP